MIKWEFKIKHMCYTITKHTFQIRSNFILRQHQFHISAWNGWFMSNDTSFICGLKELLDTTLKWTVWDIDNIQQSSLTLIFTVTTPYRLEGGSDCELPSFDTV